MVDGGDSDQQGRPTYEHTKGKDYIYYMSMNVVIAYLTRGRHTHCARPVIVHVGQLVCQSANITIQQLNIVLFTATYMYLCM